MDPPARLAALPASHAHGLWVHEARTWRSRLLGLAGLRDLPPGLGLRLPRTRSVHTVGMRFALDLIWLDAAGTVVRTDRAVPPWRVRGCRRARSVIETRSGYSGSR